MQLDAVNPSLASSAPAFIHMPVNQISDDAYILPLVVRGQDDRNQLPFCTSEASLGTAHGMGLRHSVSIRSAAHTCISLEIAECSSAKSPCVSNEAVWSRYAVPRVTTETRAIQKNQDAQGQQGRECSHAAAYADCLTSTTGLHQVPQHGVNTTQRSTQHWIAACMQSARPFLHVQRSLTCMNYVYTEQPAAATRTGNSGQQTKSIDCKSLLLRPSQ